MRNTTYARCDKSFPPTEHVMRGPVHHHARHRAVHACRNSVPCKVSHCLRICTACALHAWNVCAIESGHVQRRCAVRCSLSRTRGGWRRATLFVSCGWTRGDCPWEHAGELALWVQTARAACLRLHSLSNVSICVYNIYLRGRAGRAEIAVSLSEPEKIALRRGGETGPLMV